MPGGQQSASLSMHSHWKKSGCCCRLGRGEHGAQPPAIPLSHHVPIPRLTRGTTTAPRAPRSAPVAGGRQSPRGHRRSPAPPADGSHCGNRGVSLGMCPPGAAGAHQTPHPQLGSTHLCWYLASFSSSQAVLPPPKPSCSVRSRPWAHVGGAAQAWDPPMSCRVPPGLCHPPPPGTSHPRDLSPSPLPRAQPLCSPRTPSTP